MRDLDELVQMASQASDIVAIQFGGTDAERTRAIIRRSLECLIGNGIITIQPSKKWPSSIVIDPPYPVSILSKPKTPAICPECKAGKHDNCDGTAWDEEKDELTECFCKAVANVIKLDEEGAELSKQIKDHQKTVKKGS